MLLLATLGVAAGPAPSACACSCAPATKAEYEQRADLVFVGVVNREVADVSAAETVFTVESVVKGSAGSQVTVHSVASEASCGIRFTAGTRYEVYLRRDGARLTTNLCAGNRMLESQSQRPTASASGESGSGESGSGRSASSGEAMPPADSVRDFGPAAPWPLIAGWGVTILGVLALAGLWLGARRRRSRSGKDM